MKTLVAKLTRPRVAGIVERKRLLDHLTTSSNNKIIWISAPAGSGKTTLAANWLDRRKLPCLWYQADEGDADIATFFSYLGKAVKHAAPRYRSPLPLFTPEYCLGIPTFTKRYFEGLYGRLKKPFCLVIDDYQDVPAESTFHEVIRDGLSVAPEGISIVILSRVDPPPAFSRLRAMGNLEVLDGVELGFTFEESRALVKSRGKAKLADEVLKALYRKTEGWAAGLVLLAENIAQEGRPHSLGQVPTEQIFDYFANELYERIDDESRHFLLTTSVLPRMTVKAAEELTGNRRASWLLSRLDRTNFFTVRLETPETEYQYHPLFREFLLLRSRERFSWEGMHLLTKKAALLLLRAGYVEDAASLLIEAEDWGGLSELVLKNAEAYMAAGRFQTIGAWIHMIPADIVEQTGWLLYWRAMCCLATRPAEARTHMEKAYEIFQVNGDAAGAFLSWSGIVDTFMYEWKDFRPLDRWIEAFGELQQRYGGFPTPEIEERATSTIFAAMMFRKPHHPDMHSWETRVLAIVEKTENPSHRLFIGNSLNLYYLWSGRFLEARVLVTKMAPIAISAKAAPLPRLMWLRSEAFFCFYVTRPEDGLAMIRKGLRLAEETGIHIIDLMFYGTGIYNSMLLGDAVLAREFADKMSAMLEQGSCYAAIYHTSQSGLALLLQGKADEAAALTEKGLRLVEEAGVPLIVIAYLVQMVFVLLETSRYDKAAGYLAKIRAMGAEAGVAHAEALCAAFEARIALREGNDAVFAERFSLTLSFCKKNGLRLYACMPAALSRMCAKALELGLENDFVKETVRQRKLELADDASVPEAWPWHLKIYSLGRFELLKDDKPVIFSGKVQQKPLALLKALIAFGGSDVPQEKLTDALWPDAEGDLAHRSFDTTLHRLRKLIDNDKAIVLREGRVSLDERYCWVDTWAFERALCQAEIAWSEHQRQGARAGDPENNSDAVRLTEKAIGIYKGHFLPGDTKQPWTISLRERLRAKFMHSINALGRSWIEAGRYDKAVPIFLNGLAIDDLAEEFYQHLMVCYNQLGQQAEAVKVYNRCRSVLQSSLGLKPSSKTEGFYYVIRQGA